MAGPVKDQVILITGMGPIGLFAATVCKAAGAAMVIGTEVSPYRIGLAEKVGLDHILNPIDGDIDARLAQIAPGGVDGTLEMSGHPTQLQLAIRHTRPGGRISLLGVYAESVQQVDVNSIIFKGLDVQGIVGRNLYKTWDQMGELLKSGLLNLQPVITHVMHYTDFQKAMELMKAGQAGKVVFTFE
jgi:threonine 3-dehydrogenase